MGLTFEPTTLPDVLKVSSPSFGDDRGIFSEIFKQTDFFDAGLNFQIQQINYSTSARHVIRGLHYQMDPHAQAKLLLVLQGEVFDVAVDIRAGSPTYGKSVTFELSAVNSDMVFIPQGFAHGFCAISETAHIMYCVDSAYAPESERGIAYDDPQLAIPWPAAEPIISEKDSAFPPLAKADNNFTYEK